MTRRAQGPDPGPTCSHGAPDRTPARLRADSPPVCLRCGACTGALASLRLPGVFRLAHLLVLRGTAAAADDSGRAAPEDVEMELVVRLDRADVGDDGRAVWRDAGWLLHDLEDWDLVRLHRVGAARPVGVSLTPRGLEVLSLL